MPRLNLSLTSSELDCLSHVSQMTGYSVSSVAAIVLGEACCDVGDMIETVITSTSEPELQGDLGFSDGRTLKRRRAK